jgi:hypothetical protein
MPALLTIKCPVCTVDIEFNGFPETKDQVPTVEVRPGSEYHGDHLSEDDEYFVFSQAAQRLIEHADEHGPVMTEPPHWGYWPR